MRTDQEFTGTAGEHLALYVLAKHGIVAHHVPANGYDAFIVNNNKTYRLQIKTRTKPVSNSAGYISNSYSFKCTTEIGRIGNIRGYLEHLSNGHCEIIACVALDLERVIFIKTDKINDNNISICATEFNEECETLSLLKCGFVFNKQNASHARDARDNIQIDIFNQE